MELRQVASLQYVTIIKLGNVLWNENDAKTVLAEFPPPLTVLSRLVRKYRWMQLETKVIAKVAKLPIPELLKKKLRYVISPIGLEIKNIYSIQLMRRGVTRLYWTQMGIIDIKKMAQQLITNENLTSADRFKVASAFCFDQYIEHLWENMPYRPYKDLDHVRSNGHLPMSVKYWCHLLKGEIDVFEDFRLQMGLGINMSLYEFMFSVSAVGGNELACQYFFTKLTSEEIGRAAMTAAIRVAERRPSRVEGQYNGVNILFYLFSIMDKEQQMEVFRRELRSVLSYFFVWPWQNMFFNMPPEMWHVLSSEDYIYLVKTICENMTSGDKSYDYQILFKVIWRKIPNSYKKDVLYWCNGRSKYIELFQIWDDDNIDLVLRDAIMSIDEIAFHWGGRQIYKSLLYYNMFEKFRFFIQECSLSKDNLIKFRDQLGSTLKNIHPKDALTQEYVLYRSVKIVNQLIQECNKRKRDEKDHPIQKRGSVKYVKEKEA